ncbi:MAG: NCS1 family nucleobase:cation symporter-1 [Actinomycetia bacterium]|nr:NCS1 family nucleobase:cation symporter-1 [Actinomycetes bacterium]
MPEDARLDDALANQDLRPVPVRQRTWTWYNFMAVWMGMIHNIFNYEVAASLIAVGMGVWQAILTILTGNVLLLVVLYLNGRLGRRYGTPFPVVARAPFGVLGANIPALVRALVAIGWFGIQAYLGSTALNALLAAVFPWWGAMSAHISGVGLPLNGLISVLIYWCLFVLVVNHGMETVRRFEGWAGPVVLVVALGLIVWAVSVAHGFGPLFAQKSKFTSFGAFLPAYFAGVTSIMGTWATLGLNIPDFTRFARSDRDQIIGQALGLPLATLVFSFMSILITSGTIVAFGSAIWDPVTLIQKFHNPLVIILGAAALTVATLSVNVAANIVSPAYDLSNLLPRRIDFRTGAILTIVIALVMMPWRLLANPTAIFDLLGWSGGFIAPATAILLVDCWVRRRGHLDVAQLYRRNGIYEYLNGFNWWAVAILVVGMLLSNIGSVVPGLKALYTYSYFVGFAFAFLAYWGLTAVTGEARPAYAPGAEGAAGDT